MKRFVDVAALRASGQNLAGAARAAPPDTAAFCDETPCASCGQRMGDPPIAYCRDAPHWRAYAWRLEDVLEGDEFPQEGNSACDA